jgi:hypothetical protein
MTYDFKCTYEKCKEYNIIKEKNIPYEDIHKQICVLCKGKLTKVFSFGGGIKMADGLYKG